MKLSLKKLIGLRVREVRLLRGMTQAELAESIDRTEETVSNIERGKTMAPPDTLDTIAAVLGIATESLLRPMTSEPDSAERLALEIELQGYIAVLPLERLRIAAEQLKALTR
jgi:transcriptional regulator with XRE-family HTH domain